jgi:uncharacterized protein YjbK
MEKELKLRLPTHEDYTRLLRRLGPVERSTRQRNDYLDTDGDELRRRRIMVRFRDEGGGLVLTVKWKAVQREGYFQAEEEEAGLKARSPSEALRDGEAARALAALCPELREVDLSTLRVLGSIHNLRQRFRLEDFDLELDHSTYPNGAEDYELEVETLRPEAARELVERLLQDSGARCEPQSLTKYERFLDNVSRT